MVKARLMLDLTQPGSRVAKDNLELTIQTNTSFLTRVIHPYQINSLVVQVGNRGLPREGASPGGEA